MPTKHATFTGYVPQRGDRVRIVNPGRTGTLTNCDQFDGMIGTVVSVAPALSNCFVDLPGVEPIWGNPGVRFFPGEVEKVLG